MDPYIRNRQYTKRRCFDDPLAKERICARYLQTTTTKTTSRDGSLRELYPGSWISLISDKSLRTSFPSGPNADDMI